MHLGAGNTILHGIGNGGLWRITRQRGIKGVFRLLPAGTYLSIYLSTLRARGG